MTIDHNEQNDMQDTPTGAPSTEYEDARRAGHHWPATPPSERTEPYQFGSTTLTRCPKCGGEYDAAIYAPPAGTLPRCPRCGQNYNTSEQPTPVTATDALTRGRNAASSYSPTNY